MVAPPPAPHFDVESVSDGDDIRSPSLCFDRAIDRPASSARSLSRPAPKPKAWQRPSVCLRFNSPCQVDQPEPKPVARPTGSCRKFKPQAQWLPQSPQQREQVSWGAEAAPLPSFSNAHVYAKYPSQQVSCPPINSTLRGPTPAPLPPRVEPPGAPATKAAAFKAPRPVVKEAGFSRSLDAHADLARRNHLLFEQLCDMHFELSPVLGQITARRYSEVLRSKLLAKVSDTTAARYLRSVQIFITTFEELGGDIRNVEASFLLDTFFSLSRCPEEAPTFFLNVMKALRWYRKLLGLSPFPDLYSAAFASLVQPASGEKRESLPLPLSFHAFLERKVLDSATPQDEAIWAGSFLACIGGGLRFLSRQMLLA